MYHNKSIRYRWITIIYIFICQEEELLYFFFQISFNLFHRFVIRLFKKEKKSSISPDRFNRSKFKLPLITPIQSVQRCDNERAAANVKRLIWKTWKRVWWNRHLPIRSVPFFSLSLFTRRLLFRLWNVALFHNVPRCKRAQRESPIERRTTLAHKAGVVAIR